MAIEQDIEDLRDDFKALKARVMGHELVMTTTLAQLLKLAAKGDHRIDINAIVAEMADSVETGARAVERSDPMGAASIRAVGAEALRLLGPATRSRRSRKTRSASEAAP